MFQEKTWTPVGDDVVRPGGRALQCGLALLTGLALAVGTRQVIVRCAAGRVVAISFQPRPFGGNWTAVHALASASLLDPATDPFCAGDRRLPQVGTADLMLLAGKRVHVLLRHPWGRLPDGTATFRFGRNADERPAAGVVFHGRDGMRVLRDLAP
ncbi:MAG TPA: hypothetical protein VMI73_05645 [Trebonia sp.]|nr:hypothetical protein [Trebonia sp.]